MTAGHLYWLVAFLLFFAIPETIGILRNDFPTLSATFWWLRDTLPYGLGHVLSAATAAALTWLLGVHWIWSGLDRPGFDTRERGLLIFGAVLGLVGAVVSRRRKRD